ncbi:hypothetical protein CLV47_11796 [Antricoccus suffuscus]|uniref:Uncharacterized protein n=1 Tax=Antricoccus suffuscus TaxID=1629062 RepID=A0A2T0ZWK1_9ACTN|nr:hypothetical protein [Antricoccus suffuscus]PRZ40458.1 hypothetical protein CLV47_11796 [Antricoccus suffuscus]
MTESNDRERIDASADDETVGRRTAVRRVATALGLTAGALVVPTMVGTAEAKPGDGLKVGGTTDALDAQTALKSASNASTLRIENSKSRSGPANDAVDIIAPQIQLASPVPSGSRPQVPDVTGMRSGDMAASGGMLFYGADIVPDAVTPVQVHSAAFSNYFQSIDPAKSVLFDSATLTADERASYTLGAFDTAGRLVPGQRIGIDARTLINTNSLPGRAALSTIVTASGGDTDGSVVVHLDQTSAGDFAITQFSVLPAAVTANGKPYAIVSSTGAVTALDADDKLWLSVTAATHVKVQVTGAIIADPSAIVEPADPPAGASDPAKRALLQRQAVRAMTDGLTPPK